MNHTKLTYRQLISLRELGFSYVICGTSHSEREWRADLDSLVKLGFAARDGIGLENNQRNKYVITKKGVLYLKEDIYKDKEVITIDANDLKVMILNKLIMSGEIDEDVDHHVEFVLESTRGVPFFKSVVITSKEK